MAETTAKKGLFQRAGAAVDGLVPAARWNTARALVCTGLAITTLGVNVAPYTEEVRKPLLDNVQSFRKDWKAAYELRKAARKS